MRWRVSAWTHPASAEFRCIHHSIPILGGTFSDPEEPRGRMSFQVPVAPTETTAGMFSWRDLINSDPGTPANNRNTLIRIYRDGVDNTGEPDMEFYVERWQRRITDDGVEVMQISGPDWRVAGLDPAVARWWDYEAGATETRQPNWEYGGRNILRDDGFETTGEIPTVYELRVDATAGTYDITDGTDIATLSFDANASTIENTIEANLASITDINVTGTGTDDDPFVLEFKVPAFGVTLTADDTALTGTAEINITQDGGFDTGNWTLSQTVSDGTPRIYGAVASNDGFAVTTEQAHTGTKSLRINPLDVEVHGRYTGGQVVISGLEPGIYQASIWVRPTTGTDLYRFVLRTVWGDTLERADGQLATDTGGLGGTAFPADTWTEVTIPDVVIPQGVTEIIFRFANVNPTGNPGVFYLDDPHFARGLTASTIGVISSQLIADAQVDHAPPTVIPWVTEGAYTDTLASDGANWIREESLTIQRGKHYGTDIYAGQFYDLGYVHDLIPGDGVGGRTTPDQANWYLEIYNPGAQGETLTDTAFLLAYGIGGGVTAGRVPKQTRILAEGKGGIITEVSDATQEGQFGVWQEFLGEPDITDPTTLAGRAGEFLNRDLKNIIAVTAELDPDGPIPYEDFQRGDTANFVAGSYFSRHERRITEISLTAEMNGAGELDWTPAVTASKLLTGERARNEALYRLLTAYQRIPEERDPGRTARVGGGGGAPTIIVAASDASETAKRSAHFHCTGSNDHETINAALAAFTGIGGRLLLTEGTFNVRQSFMFPANGVHIQGMGASTVLKSAETTTNVVLTLNHECQVSDLTIEGPGIGCIAIETFGSESIISRVRFYNLEVAVNGLASGTVVADCSAETVTKFVDNGVGGSDITITGNTAPQAEFDLGTTTSIQGGSITGNVMGSLSGGNVQNTVIAGNLIEGNIDLQAQTGEGSTIEGNYIDGGSILVGGGKTNWSIRGNTLRRSPTHGIALTDCSGFLISGNRIFDPSWNAADTYDGIHLAGDSNENDIWHNKVSATLPSQPRWAINVSAATCDDNSYIGNRSGPATDYGRNGGATTTPYNDAGTNTSTTWPGAAAPQGDNFL